MLGLIESEPDMDPARRKAVNEVIENAEEQGMSMGM